MKKLLVLVVSLLVLQVSLLGAHALKAQNQDAKFSVAATICLPQGDVAPAGGTLVKFTAIGPVNEICSETVNIPEGKTTALFDFKVPEKDSKGVNVDKFKVVFEARHYLKEEFPFDTYNNITVNLKKAQYTEGTISLPLNLKAPAGGLDVKLRLVGRIWCQDPDAGPDHDSSRWEELFTNEDTVNIPEGKNSAPYYVQLNENNGFASQGLDDGDISVILEYETVKDFPEYFNKGYYFNRQDENGSFTSPYDCSDVRGLLDGTRSFNIEIIKSSLISGKVSLWEKNTDNNLLINIQANFGEYIVPFENYCSKNQANVKIPTGSSSVNYSIKVPSKKDYIVSFKPYSRLFDNYHEGPAYYYNGTTEPFRYSLIDVSRGNADNIDLNVLPPVKTVVGGKIKLEEGDISPVGGLNIHIVVEIHDDIYDSNYDVYNVGDAYIPEGQTEAPYSITLIPQEHIAFSYPIQCFAGTRLIYENLIYPDKGESGQDITLDYLDPAYYLVGSLKANSGENIDLTGFNIKLPEKKSIPVLHPNEYGVFSVIFYKASTLEVTGPGYLKRIISIPEPLTENSKTDSPVEMWAGDVNDDGAINMVDIQKIAASYGKSKNSDGYKFEFDFNQDGIIDLKDIMLAAKKFNKTSGDYPTVKIERY